VSVLSRDGELSAVSVFGYTFMARMITQEQMGVSAGLTLITFLV